METVVEVGSPKVLNRSSSRMSVSMTARKTVMSSGMVKNCGLKMPLRATSIIPDENVTPASIPRLAMIMMTCRGATREPMDELRKLTASLDTPTMRSDTASPKRIRIAIWKKSICHPCANFGGRRTAVIWNRSVFRDTVIQRSQEHN